MLRDDVDPGTYDSTFDDVSGEDSDSFDLATYLVWVTSYQPAVMTNGTLLNQWIDYFYMYGTSDFHVTDYAY